MTNVTKVATEPYVGNDLLVKIFTNGRFSQIWDGFKFGFYVLGCLFFVFFIWLVVFIVNF